MPCGTGGNLAAGHETLCQLSISSSHSVRFPPNTGGRGGDRGAIDNVVQAEVKGPGSTYTVERDPSGRESQSLQEGAEGGIHLRSGSLLSGDFDR